MKKQSILRLMIAAMIVSAAIFVMAARASHHSAATGKEDCTSEKTCEPQPQSEFFLGTLAKNLLGR